MDHKRNQSIPPQCGTTPSANIPPTLEPSISPEVIEDLGDVLIAAIRKSCGFDPSKPMTTTEKRLVLLGLHALKTAAEVENGP